MERYLKRIFEKSVILMIIVCALIYIAVRVTGMDRCPSQVISDKQITGTIIYKDGRVRSGLGPDHWRLENGDVLHARIRLPEKKPYENTSLCFSVYNSVIRMDVDGKVIYSYGKRLAEKHRQIGNIMAMVRIPDNAWGSCIDLTIMEVEKMPDIVDTSYTLIPTEKSRVFPVAGHGLEFVIFAVLMILGTVFGLVGIIFVGGKKNGTLAITIGLATFFLCSWYFGYNRFFYAISTNIRLNAMTEYYALHLVGIPITGFVEAAMEDGFWKKVIFWIGIFVAILSFGSIGLSVAGVTTLDGTLPILQIILGCLLVFLMFLIIHGYRKGRRAQDSLLIIGITFGMIFGVIEIAAIRIKTFSVLPESVRKVLSLDYAAVGLAILILTLIIWTVSRFYYDMREHTEQEELEKLAYTDQLTGIPNRISCTEKMRAITDDEWYTVAFFDVDRLKYANDNFGHRVGDALIKSAADLIKDHFIAYDGFYGRWGGDEFVAVFMNEPGYVHFRMTWEDAVKEKAQKSDLPVPFSISVGFMEHRPGMHKSINEIINAADKRMYHSKRKKKVERKQ